MTLYTLKPRFQNLLRPMVVRLVVKGVTANQVTIATALISILIGLLVAVLAEIHALFLLLPAWLFIRMALNAIDGMLAREFNQKSRLGAYLNELTDVVSDAALMLPFAMLPVFGSFWIALLIGLSLLTEFAGALGPMVGASRRYDGPLGKSDRALVLGGLALWIGSGGPLPSWVAGLMPLLAILLIATTVNRVRAGLKEATSHAAH